MSIDGNGESTVFDGTTTVVTDAKWRKPEQWGDGIAVDMHITRLKDDGPQISDIDRDYIMDRLFETLEKHGYCMGGGYELTTDAEEERRMDGTDPETKGEHGTDD